MCPITHKQWQTLKNGANGFDGYFLAFRQQTAHRAKYGETGRKSGCSHRKPEIFLFIIYVVITIIFIVHVFSISVVKIELVSCLHILFFVILFALLLPPKQVRYRITIMPGSFSFSSIIPPFFVAITADSMIEVSYL